MPILRRDRRREDQLREPSQMPTYAADYDRRSEPSRPRKKRILRYVATSGSWRKEFTNKADAIKWARDLAKDGWTSHVRTLGGDDIKHFV